MMNMSINRILTGRTGYLIGFLKCFGLVGLALWIQTRYNLEPCPLCISQRILYMSLGVLFLLAAFVKPQTVLSKILTILQVLTALGGAGVAIRHWSKPIAKQ
jgi:protein dithiol:quinone oxidoreductase